MAGEVFGLVKIVLLLRWKTNHPVAKISKRTPKYSVESRANGCDKMGNFTRLGKRGSGDVVCMILAA